MTVYSFHVTTGDVVKTIVNTSSEQWADKDETKQVPPEAKENAQEDLNSIIGLCNCHKLLDT